MQPSTPTRSLFSKLVIIGGMSRAGTTFLYHNLQKHPNIYLPPRKEVCFFAHHYDKGQSWFESFYNRMPKNSIPFDICGHYFTNSDALERIRNFNPGQKIILSIRDPIEWGVSLYEHYSRLFRVTSIDDFFRGEPIIREGHEISFRFHPGYVQEKIEAFRENFGANLLLYDFGLLAENSLDVLIAIENHTEIKRWFARGNFDDAPINARVARQLGIFDRLLQQRGLATFLSRAAPGPLVRRVRGWRDLRRARAPSAGSDTKYSGRNPEIVEYVEHLFGSDRKYVERLFDKARIRTGN